MSKNRYNKLVTIPYDPLPHVQNEALSSLKTSWLDAHRSVTGSHVSKLQARPILSRRMLQLRF